ncbi:hypothetical protein L917_21618 [Phytophthora nicotianae]|uniref:Uncharacterized protein n=1 Tax=Phytophthora nicotianae TaxID=4792 RepID=W2JX37_PHYNI|nr:hypothetical protein L917_21618 [Phytophthora nicotianae]
MELSQLRFKVFHKPGTAMGHVDSLSRLYTEAIGALTMRELLKRGQGGGTKFHSGRRAPYRADNRCGCVPHWRKNPASPELRTAQSTEPPEQLLILPVAVFGLYQE